MQLAHETGRLYEIERIAVFHSSAIFQRMQAQGLFQSDALLFINSIANVSLTNEDVEEYAQRYPELLKRLVVEITEQDDLTAHVWSGSGTFRASPAPLRWMTTAAATATN